MPEGRAAPEAPTTRDTLSGGGVTETYAVQDDQALPGAEAGAVPDHASVEPQIILGNEAYAVFNAGTGGVSDHAPSSADPVPEGSVAPSIAPSDGEAVPSTAAAAPPSGRAEVMPDIGDASVVMNRAPVAEMGPGRVAALDGEDGNVANDAAVGMNNEAVPNNAADAAPVANNRPAVVAAPADALPRSEAGAVPDSEDSEAGGSRAQGRVERGVVSGAARGMPGGDAEPPTAAGGANTTASTSTLWLELLRKAKRAVVAAVCSCVEVD